MGEQAIATLKADDEVSASAVIEPINATVGEFAIATLKAIDDESSAEPLTEPAHVPAQALEPEESEPTEEPEPTEEASDASTHQSPEQEAMAATFSVEATSLTEADSKLRAAQEQEITPPWKQLSQLREAEKYIQEVDGHINKFNSDLSQPRLDRIVSNQIKDALKNRHQLRSTKIGQIMAVADASGIIADYEALRSSGRVVLT